jgi:hypothetical protein
MEEPLLDEITGDVWQAPSVYHLCDIQTRNGEYVSLSRCARCAALIESGDVGAHINYHAGLQRLKNASVCIADAIKLMLPSV